MIITLPTGIWAGSVPVVNIPVALTEPPLFAELALIMYVSCAFIPITSTFTTVFAPEVSEKPTVVKSSPAPSVANSLI